jgi:hypothetical protein
LVTVRFAAYLFECAKILQGPTIFLFGRAMKWSLVTTL